MSSDSVYPKRDDGPSFEWTAPEMETILTDSEMSAWERDGRQIIIYNMEQVGETPEGEQWAHAKNAESWVDLGGMA